VELAALGSAGEGAVPADGAVAGKRAAAGDGVAAGDAMGVGGAARGARAVAPVVGTGVETPRFPRSRATSNKNNSTATTSHLRIGPAIRRIIAGRASGVTSMTSSRFRAAFDPAGMGVDRTRRLALSHGHAASLVIHRGLDPYCNHGSKTPAAATDAAIMKASCNTAAALRAAVVGRRGRACACARGKAGPGRQPVPSW